MPSSASTSIASPTPHVLEHAKVSVAMTGKPQVACNAENRRALDVTDAAVQRELGRAVEDRRFEPDGRNREHAERAGSRCLTEAFLVSGFPRRTP